MRARPVVPAFALLLLAGCVTQAGLDASLQSEEVVGGSGSTGGSVANVPPVVRSFRGSASTVENDGGDTETFTVEAFDANGARDLAAAEIVLEMTGQQTAELRRTVSQAEASTASSEPSGYGADGWKVWTTDPRTGVLHAKARYTYPAGIPAGAYTWKASVIPAAGVAVPGPTDATVVEDFSEVVVAATPVNADGLALPGTAWGGWSAVPGARDVSSTNYLKLTNAGSLADVSIVVDFTDDEFLGADGEFSIPIDGNVQFAWWEDTSPASTAPSQGTYAWASTSSDGSVALSFTERGSVVYVAYRIVQMPEVLASQTYAASFTATEL